MPRMPPTSAKWYLYELAGHGCTEQRQEKNKNFQIFSIIGKLTFGKYFPTPAPGRRRMAALCRAGRRPRSGKTGGRWAVGSLGASSGSRAGHLEEQLSSGCGPVASGHPGGGGLVAVQPLGKRHRRPGKGQTGSPAPTWAEGPSRGEGAGSCRSASGNAPCSARALGNSGLTTEPDSIQQLKECAFWPGVHRDVL